MRRLLFVWISVPALLAGALFAGSAGAAQRPLDLREAVAYALAHNSTVAASAAAVAAARSSFATQKTQNLPTAGASLNNIMSKSSNYGGAYAVIGAQQQSVFSQNTAQLQAQYTLTTGGLAGIQLAVSKANLEQAQANLRNAQAQVATSVTSAYNAVVQDDELVNVDRGDLQYQRLLLQNARVKERAGVAAGVDVLSARVAVARSESTLVAARANVANALDTLCQSIGAPLDTHFSLPKRLAMPPLPAMSMQKIERIALANRADIASAREALRVADLNRKSWLPQLFPQIQLSAAVGNQFSPTNAVFTQQQLDYEYAAGLIPHKIFVPRGTPGFWQIQALSTFNLPIVDYGARRLSRVNYEAAVRSARLALENTKLVALNDVRSAYRAATSAIAQVGFAKQEARLGIESARIKQLQYRAGVAALSDVVQAQQTSISAQNDLISARVAYVDALVRLRTSMGIFSPTNAVADLH